MSLTKVSYSMISGASVNVLDYGAVGDGVTDDTVAILAAFNYALDNNKTLYFPAGTYYLDTDLGNYTLNRTGDSGFAIRGDGFGNTILLQSVDLPTGILSLNSASNFTIDGITFDCNNTGVDINTGFHGLGLVNCSNYTISNCQIKHTAGYGIAAQGSLGLGTTSIAMFDNLRIIRPGNDGVDFKNYDDDNRNIYFSNIYIEDPGWWDTTKPGLDIRGPAVLKNITVAFINSTQPQIGIRFRDDAGMVGGKYSSLTNFHVRDYAAVPTLAHFGVVIDNSYISCSNGTVESLNGVAFLLGDVTAGGYTKISNCYAVNVQRGFYINESQTTLISCFASVTGSGATPPGGECFRSSTSYRTVFIACDAVGGSYGFRSAGGAQKMILSHCSVDGTAYSGDFALGTTGQVFQTDGWTGNIDLDNDGTGQVQFGTEVASADVPVTGYLAIRNVAGTVVKLAVIA